MLKFVISAAVIVPTAFGAWVYEGQWGKKGSGEGQLSWPSGVAFGPNDVFYVAESGNRRIQYFTETGSFLGTIYAYLEFIDPRDVDVAANGNVYVVDKEMGRVTYWTSTGSLLGSWYGQNGVRFEYPHGVGVAAGGTVYVADTINCRVQYFTATGSYLGQWGSRGAGNGQFYYTVGICFSANSNVYVVDSWNHRVQYFTPGGSFLGKWGYEFNRPYYIAAAPNGDFFVADTENNCIKHFDASGSFLASWGELGSGPGMFHVPCGVAVSRTGARVYVADYYNHRIQYFRWSDPAVAPSSLGKVKALFK